MSGYPKMIVLMAALSALPNPCHPPARLSPRPPNVRQSPDQPLDLTSHRVSLIISMTIELLSISLSSLTSLSI